MRWEASVNSLAQADSRTGAKGAHVSAYCLSHWHSPSYHSQYACSTHLLAVFPWRDLCETDWIVHRARAMYCSIHLLACCSILYFVLVTQSQNSLTSTAHFIHQPFACHNLEQSFDFRKESSKHSNPIIYCSPSRVEGACRVQ